MKKFTKLFLSCAAVTAVTAAVATSAMAAAVTGDLTGTYDEETGKLTLDAAATPAGVATILVLDAGANETDVKKEDILYINQKDAETASFGDMGLLGKPTADGVYKVKVGYYEADGTTFAIKTGQFTIGNVGTELLIGDVDASAEIDGDDATAILRKVANKTTLTGHVGDEYTNVADNSKVIVGDVDASKEVDGDDATAILRKVANKTTLTGHVGETITVIPVDSAK